MILCFNLESHIILNFLMIIRQIKLVVLICFVFLRRKLDSILKCTISSVPITFKICHELILLDSDDTRMTGTHSSLWKMIMFQYTIFYPRYESERNVSLLCHFVSRPGVLLVKFQPIHGFPQQIMEAVEPVQPAGFFQQTPRWVGPLLGASVAAMSRLIFAPKAGSMGLVFEKPMEMGWVRSMGFKLHLWYLGGVNPSKS